MPPALIVLSHLRWDFVYQRPQHLMERIAAHSKVFFVEEPELRPGRAEMTVREVASNIFVCRPQTSCTTPGFVDPQLPEVAVQLKSLLQRFQLRDYGVWFYTPMALPLLDAMQPAVVVYDCMDELSAFRNADPKLLAREQALFGRADVVFTGGPSLFAAKRDFHPNVHCFPSSVDKTHFARAGDVAAEHAAQIAIPRPRLGYFGVIDERMDLALLDAVAQRSPKWQFVMVGPHVKIEPALLPQRPNIHYFGQRSYDELPRFIAGWDVCLQPFALNEATRFISPTKTLEYMAAGKPIVSTPIRDVEGPYGHLVAIAHGAEEFTAACANALDESPIVAAKRRSAMSEMLASTSWDVTAGAMRRLVEEAVLKRNNGRRSFAAPARSPDRIESRASSEIGNLASQVGTVVIGAGPTGLSAGYHLGEDSLILEQNSSVGGWCRSIEDGGYTFDHAGHIMFSNDPYVHMLYSKLLGDNLHWQDREAWIYSKHTYTRYPFQGALYGLPPDVLKECLVGAIEARFGPLKGGLEARRSLHSVDSTACALKSESLIDCCGDGLAESMVPLGTPARPSQRGEGENFEQFIYRVWGAGVARHFAIPYNRKLWAVPLSEMETSWLGGRVPMPDLEEMIEGALQPVAKPQGPNARFGYPLRGGFQALMNGFLPLLEGRLVTGAKVVQIDPFRRRVRLADGQTFGYQHLISTAPLPSLLAMLGSAVPPRVAAARPRLGSLRKPRYWP
jgi:UDP-galactopyranose mutase